MNLLYRVAMAAARLAAPLFSSGSSKLARGLRGRSDAHVRLEDWGSKRRDSVRPTAWIHAPSVGEGLQARAVSDALRSEVPSLQVAYTHFSPSAEKLAEAFGADVATYLPWDLPGPVGSVLDAVEPDLVVFTKTEVWPTVVDEAVRRGVPVALVAGTVPDGAGRARWPARVLLRDSWRSLSLACACSDADAAGLEALGVPAERVVVTGDPGIDSAAARFAAVPGDARYLAPFGRSPRPTVVAGSTWPADEQVLVPALTSVRSDVRELRAIIAPHEPTPEHVEDLRVRLVGAGWRVGTLAEIESSGDAEAVDAVVVDRVGVLAHLYGVASVSYVGGGFHGDGLHSVLEPAAASTPVVFGPKHTNSRAAGDLLREGGAKLAADSDDLASVLRDWLLTEESRRNTGRAAADYIERHRGAARRTASHLMTLIDR